MNGIGFKGPYGPLLRVWQKTFFAFCFRIGPQKRRER